MADLPPSYEEVVKNPPIRRNQPSVTPSAPLLESTDTQPNDTQEQLSKPALPNPYSQAARFSAWDDRATKILVVNRLDMNERFDKARNQLERHLLWNVILNHLLAAGYNFARIDLMQYWRHIFSIYKSIINELYAGNPVDTTWKYFESMDNVFKYTTKRPKSREGDYDTITQALPSQPMFTIVHNGIHSQPLITPHENIGVVTAQPRSSTRGYTPLETSNDRNDHYDGCCWCCWLLCGGCYDDCRDAFREGCCADNPSAYIARTNGNALRPTAAAGRTARDTSRTGGYTGRSGGYTTRTGGYAGRTSSYTDRSDEYTSYNNNYNTVGITDGYTGIHSVNVIDDLTSGVTNNYSTRDFNGHDNNHRHTSSHTNDNSCDNRTDKCCDTGGGGTSYSCNDTGRGSTSYSCHDTGGGSTSYSSHDTGGGSTSYSCHDTGGGSTDYGCSDTGGTDYSCCDTGGGGYDD